MRTRVPGAILKAAVSEGDTKFSMSGGISMKRVSAVLAFLMITLLAGASVFAQGGKALTNQDVISMVKILLPESVILSAIKTNDTNFDVSATGLIALKKAGVSAKVMEAMLDAANNKKNGAGAATPAASGTASTAPSTIEPLA